MRIVLVRKGTLYGPEYVSALLTQIKRHNPDAEIITLTDQDDTPGQIRLLDYQYKGWWSKLELFSLNNTPLRPFLYIDLDSFVFQNLDYYGTHDGFTMVHDFFGCVEANSSVMWIPKDTTRIWHEFRKHATRIMDENRTKGDQGYLSKYVEKLWESPQEGIVSYKKHGKDGPLGAIMQFHGKPKPHQATGWAGDYWKGLVDGGSSGPVTASGRNHRHKPAVPL